MFKLNVHLISLLNSMGLSKKNLGKLNTFIKNNNWQSAVITVYYKNVGEHYAKN